MSTLKPHEEILHKIPEVLIAGKGWVGTEVAKSFPDATQVDENNSAKNFEGKMFDYCFICVPTPPNEDGSCDTSIVEDVFNEYGKIVDTFIIRSTVNLGFTEQMSKKGYKVVFQPEYIGETVAHPYLAHGTDFIILGGDKGVVDRVGHLWAKVSSPTIRIQIVDSRTAELAKLMENSFLACKVTFFNQFFDLAESFDVNYHQLRESFLLDERMGRSHTQVYPDNRGYAGKCLPKDVANAIFSGKKLGADVSFLEAMQEYNARLRERNGK